MSADRILREGPNVTSLAELLAAILHIDEGVAVDLARSLGGVNGLSRLDVEALLATHGIGNSKAAALVAAVELGRRISQAIPDDRLTIRSPADAADLLRYQMSAYEQEYLFVILLDTRNRVIGTPREIYHGSLNTSMIRVGEVFRDAVKANAAGIIVVHNHPSGDPSPSPEDVAVTRAIVEAGKLLDVNVLDHLIIGGGRFVSLKERGLGFSG